MSRLRRSAGLLATLAAMITSSLVAACGGPVSGMAEPAPSASLGFSYVHVAGPGYINQTVEITNDGDRAVAPRLAYTPVDASGTAVDGVTVETAYGSDAGRVVVPGRYAVIDILIFRGSGAHRVADVRVAVQRTDVLDYPTVDSEVEVEPLDARGRVVDNHQVFDSVRLFNANRSPVTVCVVYLVYGDIGPDGTQQLRHVALVAGPTDTRSGSTQLPVSEDARRASRKFANDAAVSLKAYFCHAARARSESDT